MEYWQKNKLHTLELNEEGRAAFEKIARNADSLGFTHCSVGLAAPYPISNPACRLASNYPDSWKQEYFNKGYFSVDPVVKNAYQSLDWMVWTAESHATAPDLWQARLAAGLRYGLSIPTRGTHGTKGVFSLTRFEPYLSEAEIEEKKLHLAWLAQTVHPTLEQHMLPEVFAVHKANLTEREIEILRMLAEGKTSDDIANMLQITKRTIDFHISNSVSKLGVENRTAATTLLAVLGML